MGPAVVDLRWPWPNNPSPNDLPHFKYGVSSSQPKPLFLQDESGSRAAQLYTELVAL